MQFFGFYPVSMERYRFKLLLNRITFEQSNTQLFSHLPDLVSPTVFNIPMYIILNWSPGIYFLWNLKTCLCKLGDKCSTCSMVHQSIHLSFVIQEFLNNEF